VNVTNPKSSLKIARLRLSPPHVSSHFGRASPDRRTLFGLFQSSSGRAIQCNTKWCHIAGKKNETAATVDNRTPTSLKTTSSASLLSNEVGILRCIVTAQRLDLFAIWTHIGHYENTSKHR
jgi:hypothetical protein